MGNEYRGKVFKSGNSVAIRVPKVFGLTEGTEVVLREVRTGFNVEPISPAPRKIDLTGIVGSCPGLTPRSPEERAFEPAARVWDDPTWTGMQDIADA